MTKGNADMDDTERAAAERELFLAWAKDNLGQGYSLSTDEDGMFFDKVTRWAFRAWKAGRAQEAPALPPHLRDDAPYLACTICGRKSWSLDSAGERCGMTQPSGALCGGVMLEAAPEQHPSLKSTPYGPAILLDDVRDAERMDWLERQDLNDIAMIRQTNGVIGINVGSGPFYGKTLRAAIDAARAAAPKEPTP